MVTSSGYPARTANNEQCQVVNGSSSNKSSWNPQLPGPLLTLPPDSVPTGQESFEKQPEHSETKRQALNARLNVVLVLDPPFWGQAPPRPPLLPPLHVPFILLVLPLSHHPTESYSGHACMRNASAVVLSCRYHTAGSPVSVSTVIHELAPHQTSIHTLRENDSGVGALCYVPRSTFSHGFQQACSVSQEWGKFQRCGAGTMRW